MDTLKLTYKRSHGMRLVYEVEVAGSRYRIFHSGELLRDAPAPTPAFAHVNPLEVAFVRAIDDIEKLTGMVETVMPDNTDAIPAMPR
ncbi:MAG TPA: hypothetical protein VE029_02710 [Rhizobacter sp.]|nr:hypothetical protein [Rhizobacter sp.]